jgi:hypothetical protein
MLRRVVGKLPPFYLLGLFTLLAFVPIKEHAFYVSITELNIVDDTLQISLRLFTDDLEFALNERSEEKIFLEAQGDERKAFVYIKDYVNASFSVGNGAKDERITWLGHEFEDDVCWIYGQTPLPAEQHLLFVRNAVLMDVYPRQQNIVHLQQDNGVVTKLATKDNSELRFILK